MTNFNGNKMGARVCFIHSFFKVLENISFVHFLLLLECETFGLLLILKLPVSSRHFHIECYLDGKRATVLRILLYRIKSEKKG